MSSATLIRRISAPSTTPPSVRRLRIAVTALFAVSGTVFGTWAARIPDVSERVGADHATLGVALLCISLGSLVGMKAAGALCNRFGAGRVAAIGGVVISALLVLPGLAGDLVQLCGALGIFGIATGGVNVAANSLGVDLGRRTDRPVMSALHAGFSFGGLAGALLGGLLAGFLGITAHFVLVAVLCAAVAAVVAPTLRAAEVTGPAESEHAPESGPEMGQRTLPTPALVVLLGVIAGCTAFGEGALSDWGALHLRENLGASVTIAAAGYAGFSLAMAVGRLTGSRFIMRFGDTPVLVTGTVIAAAGMLTALYVPLLPIALAGFVAVGLGLANVFPLAIGRAGLLGGARGIALASMVGYTGLLGGPPLIGFVAGAAGLPLALTSVCVLCLVAGVLSLAVGREAAAALSVAATLRAQARARLEPARAKATAATQRHGTDLLLLMEGTR